MFGSTMDEGELRKVLNTPILMPKRADRPRMTLWKPVPHDEVVRAILADYPAFRVYGACTSNVGRDLSALFACGEGDGGYRPAFGIQTGNSTRRGVRFYCGALLEGGYLVIDSCRDTLLRNDGGLDLGKMAKWALDWWHEVTPTLPDAMSSLRGVRMFSSLDLPQVLVRMASSSVVVGSKRLPIAPWGWLSTIDLGFRRTGGTNALDLAVAHSLVAWQRNPSTAMDRSFALYKLLVASEQQTADGVGVGGPR